MAPLPPPPEQVYSLTVVANLISITPGGNGNPVKRYNANQVVSYYPNADANKIYFIMTNGAANFMVDLSLLKNYNGSSEINIGTILAALDALFTIPVEA
jgi:hypothetical protein